VAIGLHAAFSDGVKDERERIEFRRIAESLAEEASTLDLARIYQDVLFKRVSLKDATAALTAPEQRRLAYEMALCVCDADGRQSESERRFLAALKKLLRLDPGQAAAFENEADAIVALSEAAAPATATSSFPVTPGPVMAATSKVPEAEIDKSILNYPLVNGALELLPQSWASMAIIPLQITMVYSIGKAAGKTFGKLGHAATGMAFSFATTYALGQLAKRYYAGGRVMNTTVLRDSFQNLLGTAKKIQTQYLPQIRQQADTLDMGRVMATARGT